MRSGMVLKYVAKKKRIKSEKPREPVDAVTGRHTLVASGSSYWIQSYYLTI
jgi:hypothetical protein